MTHKILFIGPHRPNRSPSQRFRMEQFFPYLKTLGFECDYSWYIGENDDQVFYSKGHWTGKLFVFLKALRIRLGDVIRSNQYDVIFIQREAFMTGSAFFEKQFSRSKAKVIFDFDDAIWLEDTSLSNQKLSWLKRPAKTADILGVADAVIAGNSFLADYARKFNPQTHVIPTVIDTSVFVPPERKKTSVVNIGWSGSLTTQKHFELLLPVLKKLKDKFGLRIHFIKIGGQNISYDDLQVQNINWSLKTELEDLHKIDIGLMPLPDNDWSRGKCGFKALLYMSLAIPPVISPIGMNTEIIKHGESGFFANSEEEWIAGISELVESFELRQRIGKAARETVIKKYSVDSQLPALISLLTNTRKKL